jgi:hypothetical protein
MEPEAMPTAESADILYHLTSTVGLIVLLALYLFGVWSRSYVMPTSSELPLRRQLVASIPVGLLTMSAYAKSALPSLAQSQADMPFDLAMMAGYAIVFGMLSRESLERLLQVAVPPLAKVPGGSDVGRGAQPAA